VKDPCLALESRLSGLANLSPPNGESLFEGVPNLVGDWPNVPRRAWDNEEAPGPGAEVPDAPAKGSDASSTTSADASFEPGPGEPKTGAARRAVTEALEGETESVDSSRRWLPMGRGRPLDVPEGTGTSFDIVTCIVREEVVDVDVKSPSELRSHLVTCS